MEMEAAAAMDFNALSRRELQALCKLNGVRANMTNLAMVEALQSLASVSRRPPQFPLPIRVIVIEMWMFRCPTHSFRVDGFGRGDGCLMRVFAVDY